MAVGIEASEWKMEPFWELADGGLEEFYPLFFQDLLYCGITDVMAGFGDDDIEPYTTLDTIAKNEMGGQIKILPSFTKLMYAQDEDCTAKINALTNGSSALLAVVAEKEPVAMWVADDQDTDYIDQLKNGWEFRAELAQTLGNTTLAAAPTTGAYQTYYGGITGWNPISIPLHAPYPGEVWQQAFHWHAQYELEESWAAAEAQLAACAQAQIDYGIDVGLWLQLFGHPADDLPPEFEGFVLPEPEVLLEFYRRARYTYGLTGRMMVFTASHVDAGPDQWTGLYHKNVYATAIGNSETIADALVISRDPLWDTIQDIATLETMARSSIGGSLASGSALLGSNLVR